MNSVIFFAGYVFGLLIVFKILLAIQNPMLWYWKIDTVLNVLERNNRHYEQLV